MRADSWPKPLNVRRRTPAMWVSQRVGNELSGLELSVIADGYMDIPNAKEVVRCVLRYAGAEHAAALL